MKKERIKDSDLSKHLAIMNNRIYRIDTMADVTDQQYVMFDGYAYDTRRAAFYILNARWPARGFLLPWE